MARERGVMVRMIDLVKLENIAMRRNPEYAGVGYMTTGVIYNAAGDMRTVNGEGVTDDGHINNGQGVWVFADRFAVYTWNGWVEFTRAEIESALTHETVDLADFIRTFGARLESNFYLAYTFATN